uniref:Uncharacterized protein n=1 Tax=Meloidogyne enterolobii TaxID=390850 RepID=A0A6V7UW28_MELEN|nr:unnamed protein product [Meloidogyne enterolobii]
MLVVVCVLHALLDGGLQHALLDGGLQHALNKWWWSIFNGCLKTAAGSTMDKMDGLANMLYGGRRCGLPAVDGWRTCFWVVGGQYAFGWLVNMLLGGWRTCYGWSICFWMDGFWVCKCGATPVQLRLCGAQHGGLAVSTLQLALVRKILILNKKWQKFKCASAVLYFFCSCIFSFVFVLCL